MRHYIATPGHTGHWADTQVCVCVADNVLSQVSFTRMGIVYPPNYCRGSSQLGLMVFALCVSEDEGGTAQHHTPCICLLNTFFVLARGAMLRCPR